MWHLRRTGRPLPSSEEACLHPCLSLCGFVYVNGTGRLFNLWFYCCLLSKKLDDESQFRHTDRMSSIVRVSLLHRLSLRTAAVRNTKCVCCGSVTMWCVFCCQVIHLSHWPLLRDSVYYTLSISALIVVRRLCITWMSVIRTCFPFLMFFSHIPSFLLQFIYDEKVVW